MIIDGKLYQQPDVSRQQVVGWFELIPDAFAKL